VNGELIARAALSPHDVREMYGLFTSHFERVSEDQFRADLAHKHWVILLHDRGTLQGFSSLQLLHTQSTDGPVSVIYSGDTIVRPEARSTTLLARTWIDAVRRISEGTDVTNLHWLLLVSGFRTYRLLPLFWKRFFPNWSEATPASVRAGVDSLGRSMFGGCYDPRAGIVRFANPQPLRPELSQIPEQRLADPHVKFFAAANPGHAQGDELVCWTRLSHDNLTAAGKRMWHASDGAHAHSQSTRAAAAADLA
jgi:hypothetical protein